MSDASHDHYEDGECPFCAIVAGKAPASIVYEDDDVMSFLDVNPANPGHALVIPREHVAHLPPLDEATGGRVFQVAMRVAAALRGCEAVQCEGVNFSLADGAVAGQEVFHLHLHVLPRHEGDGLSLWAPRSPADRDELDELADHLAARL